MNPEQKNLLTQLDMVSSNDSSGDEINPSETNNINELDNASKTNAISGTPNKEVTAGPSAIQHNGDATDKSGSTDVLSSTKPIDSSSPDDIGKDDIQNQETTKVATGHKRKEHGELGGSDIAGGEDVVVVGDDTSILTQPISNVTADGKHTTCETEPTKVTVYNPYTKYVKRQYMSPSRTKIGQPAKVTPYRPLEMEKVSTGARCDDSFSRLARAVGVEDSENFNGPADEAIENAMKAIIEEEEEEEKGEEEGDKKISAFDSDIVVPSMVASSPTALKPFDVACTALKIQAEGTDKVFVECVLGGYEMYWIQKQDGRGDANYQPLVWEVEKHGHFAYTWSLFLFAPRRVSKTNNSKVYPGGQKTKLPYRILIRYPHNSNREKRAACAKAIVDFLNKNYWENHPPPRTSDPDWAEWRHRGLNKIPKYSLATDFDKTKPKASMRKMSHLVVDEAVVSVLTNLYVGANLNTWAGDNPGMATWFFDRPFPDIAVQKLGYNDSNPLL